MIRVMRRLVCIAVLVLAGLLGVAERAEAAPTAYQESVLGQNPSLFWELNDSSCCTAADSSGHGLTGSFGSPGISYHVPGAMAGAANDGVSANGSVFPVIGSYSSGLPSANSSRSVELWFKTTDASDQQTLFSYGSAAANEWFALVLNYVAGDMVFTQYGQNYYFPLPHTVTDGAWHQVVLTWNSSTDSLTLFLDGSPVGSGAWGSALDTPSSGTVEVGGGVDAYFKGGLQDFAIFGAALSASVVRSQYFASLPAGQQALTNNNPSLLWQLGDSGCCVAVDSSGNGSNGSYPSSGITYGVAGEPGTGSANAITANGSVFPVSGSYSGLPSGNSSRSVELWFKTTDATDPQTLFSYGGDSQNELFALVLNYVAGDLVFTQYGQNYYFPLPRTITDGAWHQVVLTWNSTTDSLGLFLDGSEVGTGAWGSALDTPSSGSVDVGGGVDAYFKGSLQDFAVYPSVLTPPTITAQYDALAGVVPAKSTYGFSEDLRHRATCDHGPGTVNCASGDMDDTFTDIDIASLANGLAITRTYNSLNANVAPQAGGYSFGPGWSCSICWSLSQDSYGDVTITEGDGSQIVATPDGSGGYDVPPRYDATLKEVSQGGGYYYWCLTENSGLSYTFSSAGVLAGISDADGYLLSTSETVLFEDTIGDGIVDFRSDVPLGHLVLRTTDNARDEITSFYSATVGGDANTEHTLATYGYNSAGYLTNVTNADGDEWQYGYNAAGQMTSMTDPDGNTMTTTFDSSGRVLTQTQANGAETQFSYAGDPFSADGGSTIITDPDGNEELQVYAGGELTSLTKGYGTRDPVTSSYTYDPSCGGITSATNPRGKTTDYTYDGDGNMLTETLPSGAESSYTYNSFDEILTATDPLGTTTTNAYNADGDLLSTSTPVVSVNGTTTGTQTTQYTYGNASLPGYPTAIEDPDGKTTDVTYDSDSGEVTSITDPLGNETTFSYDADGRLLSTVAPKGNVSGCGCAGSYTTTYTYNALNELLSETDADGNESTSTYDADGNELTSTEPSGNKTVTTYNDVNEPTEVQVKDPGGSVKQTTGTGYDLDGDVTSQTDGNGNETAYVYNALGEETSATNALGKATTYTYDPDGNLATELTPNGTTATDSYNDDDELTGTIYSGGASTPSVGYSYDADGRQIGMSDGTGTSTWAYNSLGELTGYTNGAGNEVAYGYDLDGNQTSITYPGGHVLTQTYDDDGDLKTLTDWNSNESTFDYDPDGNLTTEALANGVSDAYTYDHADNLTGIDDTKALATVFSATYTLNSDEQVATDSSQPASTGSYGYTALDQLCYAGSETSSACSSPPSGSDAYSYDPGGNLTDNDGTTQTYNAGDQLCWTTASSSSNGCGTAPTGATTYSYDNDGNRTATTPATGSATAYGYNGSDELTRYQLGTSPATTYAYDGNGQLQSQTTSGTATSYTWDASASIPVLLQQTTGGNTTSYIYGPQGLPLEEILPSGGTYYYAHDQLGSTRALTNSTGTVQDTDQYDPYGNTTSSTGTVPNPLLYTGGLKDPQSGLYYAQARYYDPTTGQFLTIDPLVAETGQPYAYTDGDPINDTDPTGLASAPEGAGLAGILVDPIPEPISTGPEIFVPAPTPDPAPDYPVSGPLITGPESYPAADPSPDQPECFPTLDGSGLSVGTLLNNADDGDANSKGSTGRNEPTDLAEQLALQEAKSHPADGQRIPIVMGDKRWPASDGWVKMKQRINGIEIHYVYNRETGAADDFKFK